MECLHNSISLIKGYPSCINCGTDFKNGELAKIRKERESNCNHLRLEHGYASRPPKSKCLDCGGYFDSRSLT